MAEPNAPAKWTLSARLINGVLYGKKAKPERAKSHAGLQLERGRAAGWKNPERFGRERDLADRPLERLMTEYR
jgi:hypothetical protein